MSANAYSLGAGMLHRKAFAATLLGSSLAFAPTMLQSHYFSKVATAIFTSCSHSMQMGNLATVCSIDAPVFWQCCHFQHCWYLATASLLKMHQPHLTTGNGPRRHIFMLSLETCNLECPCDIQTAKQEAGLQSLTKPNATSLAERGDCFHKQHAHVDTAANGCTLEFLMGDALGTSNSNS